MKKSKSSLFLMELIIVVFFFALTSAVCLQVFVKAHVIDRQTQELNHAVLWSQNCAECFYEFGDDPRSIADILLNTLTPEMYFIDDSAIHFGLNRQFELMSLYALDEPTYEITLNLSSDSDFIYANFSMTYLPDALVVYSYVFKEHIQERSR